MEYNFVILQKYLIILKGERRAKEGEEIKGKRKEARTEICEKKKRGGGGGRA